LAGSILGWPDGFVGRAEPALLALRQGEQVGPETAAELERAGLVDGASRLTPLGGNVAYHLYEYRRQADGSPAARWPLDCVEADAAGSLLDVGCGAGQTLLCLGKESAAQFVGVDVDLKALALGCRLAGQESRPVQFVRGTAYDLPFREDSFSRVISRVALNEMHQERALVEMCRVLRPGGLLYCRAEGPGHDVQRLLKVVASPRVLGRLRDGAVGIVLACTGWQPTPGSLVAGTRTFATAGRLTKMLARGGCDVVHAEVLARFGGLPRSIGVIARKRPR
jgi:SAM-dependent methyltransferase